MTEDAKIRAICGKCMKGTWCVDTGERDDKGHIGVMCTECNTVRWVN